MSIPPEMLRRGEHHTNFRQLIAGFDAQSLTPGEREQFLDTADMLLFDESDAENAKSAVFALIDQFIGAGVRHDWTETRAHIVKITLEGCGGSVESEPSATS
jgi:hypothetical protein